MEEIRSMLKGSNSLQRVVQFSSTGTTGYVVSGEIRNRLKHLNQSVDRKVEDLYRNILGNFSRTVLPASSPAVDELYPVRICVDNKPKENGISCRELIPLRRKKQLEEPPLTKPSDNKRQENKYNELSIAPALLASKTKMHPADERRAFVEIRLERTTKEPVCLPNISRGGSSSQLADNKPAKMQEPKYYRNSSANSPLVNERALLEKYESETFKMVQHELDDSTVEFLEFQRANHHNWNAILAAIYAVKKFSKRHSFPDSKIDPKAIMELAKSTQPYKRESLLQCFSDVENMLAATPSRYLRYEGKVGRLRAIVRIQAWFRMKKQTKQFKKYRLLIASIVKIQTKWRCYRQLQHTRSLIKYHSNRILYQFETRQSDFRRNWPKLKEEYRVEIHINSSFIGELKRLTSEKFIQKENCQITRVFRLRDPRLTVVYICPFPLSDYLISYYIKVLEISQVHDVRKRLLLVWPENRFSDSGCVCENLLYSAKCMKRIKSIIKGKQAYLVPGYPSDTYLRIADQLEIPIYGGLPSKCRYLSSKSGIRYLTERHLPCDYDMFTIEQVVASLAALIVRYPKVYRWFFKMDDERYARGTAFLDMCWLRKFKRLQPSSDAYHTEYLISLLDKHLHKRLRIVHKCLFKTYDEFIRVFVCSGGVIEASPNYPESQIRTSTFLVQIEPEGTFSLLGSYDRINWQLKPVSCQYPSEFNIPTEELEATSRKLYRRGIIGYISMDYLNCSEQEYWLVGVDCYLNNLSAIFFTAQAIGCYKVYQGDDRKKVYGYKQISSKEQLRFLYCPVINHSGLAELQMRTFFHLCRLSNISFDINRRIGSVFLLMDTLQSGTLGLLSFCDNNYGLYRYMTNAFEFLGSRLDGLRLNGIYEPRTDYVSFEDLKNRFRTLLKKLEKGKKKTHGDRLQMVE